MAGDIERAVTPSVRCLGLGLRCPDGREQSVCLSINVGRLGVEMEWQVGTADWEMGRQS